MNEQTVAKRSTGLLIFLLVLYWIWLAVCAFSLGMALYFRSELDAANFIFIIIIFSASIIYLLFFAILFTYYIIKLPRTLIKISDGILYLCPNKKTSIPIKSLKIHQIKLENNVWDPAYLFSLAGAWIIRKIKGYKGHIMPVTGKIIIQTNKKNIKLAFIEDFEKAYYFIKHHLPETTEKIAKTEEPQ